MTNPRTTANRTSQTIARFALASATFMIGAAVGRALGIIALAVARGLTPAKMVKLLSLTGGEIPAAALCAYPIFAILAAALMWGRWGGSARRLAIVAALAGMVGGELSFGIGLLMSHVSGPAFLAALAMAWLSPGIVGATGLRVGAAAAGAAAA